MLIKIPYGPFVRDAVTILDKLQKDTNVLCFIQLTTKINTLPDQVRVTVKLSYKYLKKVLQHFRYIFFVFNTWRVCNFTKREKELWNNIEIS